MAVIFKLGATTRNDDKDRVKGSSKEPTVGVEAAAIYSTGQNSWNMDVGVP